jgi:hypothetical protein
MEINYQDYLKFYNKDVHQKNIIRDKEKNKINFINSE